MYVVLAGRALFKVYFAPEAKVNDLYSFALGIYIMAGLGTVIHWCIECYSTYKANGYNQDEIMTYMKEKTGKVMWDVLCKTREKKILGERETDDVEFI